MPDHGIDPNRPINRDNPRYKAGSWRTTIALLVSLAAMFLMAAFGFGEWRAAD